MSQQNLHPPTAARDDRDVAKDFMIRLRVSGEEHAAWLKAAELEQMSLSNWIRRRCNGLATAAPVIKPKKRR
jgi:predicted HicB family RNase H-like nuclease